MVNPGTSYRYLSGHRSIPANSLLFVCLYFLPHATSTSSIPVMFTFGDANVETGNNNYINTTLKTNFYPFGRTYFGRPSGRVTDGRITSDFLASYLHLPFLPPFLEPNANFSHGINFGSGGAGALAIADIGPNRGIPLDQQIRYFESVRNGSVWPYKEEDFSDALYYLQVGEVDYVELAIFSQQLPALRQMQGPIRNAVIGAVETALRRLYTLGARKFIVFTVYPLGCMPLLLSGANATNGVCLDFPDELAAAHNVALEKLVGILRQNLTESTILFMKSDEILSDVEQNPTNYGFLDTKTACCGLGLFNGGTACGQGNFTVCPETSRHIYWDQVHNTEAFFQIVAQEAWGGSKYIDPINLSVLAQRGGKV